jgi:hypothetical protein
VDTVRSASESLKIHGVASNFHQKKSLAENDLNAVFNDQFKSVELKQEQIPEDDTDST